jgi:hypothetical protein
MGPAVTATLPALSKSRRIESARFLRRALKLLTLDATSLRHGSGGGGATYTGASCSAGLGCSAAIVILISAGGGSCVETRRLSLPARMEWATEAGTEQVQKSPQSGQAIDRFRKTSRAA